MKMKIRSIKPLRYLIYKDLLLLIRDLWGVILLFFMPWVLVVLMTYLQDSTFRSVNENHIPLYLLDADRDSLGSMIGRQLMASGIFEVSTSANGHKLTPEELEDAVYKGDYMIGIIIPPNTTEKIRAAIRRKVESAFSGEDDIAVSEWHKPLGIKLLIDPATKQSFRASISGIVKENALTVQNRMLLNEISRQVSVLTPVSIHLDADMEAWFKIDETYSQSGKLKTIPNSTQHNVPAWSMFAVFFIVVSLSGNMIRERETGCYNRLMTMPCSFGEYVVAKIVVYLVVCILQLAMMISSGLFIMPLFGLPALKLGSSIMALVLLSVASSLAAIGYGLAIGSIARTNQQASVFGAVSVVILAAVGGVWIPTFLMPRFMRIVSYISPLNWGVNGFNDIFVRDAGCIEVLPFIIICLVFFFATSSLSVYNMKRKMK
ncbi:MAG: ABC transporter permease [Tannerella sp.]|jgi:ABC-2 type transport system permease protein|nr:ABC transporter permease [Tannerella sp.]